ncbi:MAG TPA: glycosyltransferase family 2 protein [Candidatus Udaeobacter sp.]|nr:glycosyltransferase family 2 protein [Candidatus Udaeobacter sp.]
MTAEQPGPPRVLLIVVHWSRADLTARCVESLLAGTYPAADLLLIDNGSPERAGAALAARYPRVELLRLETNRYYAGGANRGLERALAGDYAHAILFNNDTEAAPDLVAELVQAAAADPRIGLVGPKIYYANPRDLIWSAGGDLSLWSGMSEHRGLRQPDGPAWDEPADVDYLTGACLLFTRPTLAQVGLLDEEYVMYAEDADYCLRARAHGLRVVYAPRARLWHEVSAASGGGLTSFKMYHRVRSTWRLLARHARPWHWLTIPILLPLHFAAFALKELLRGNGGVVRAALRALADLVRGAPRRAA